MRLPSIKYPLFLCYELIRLLTILMQGAATPALSLPITWYAAVPLLCLVPALFFMLSFGEEERASWLPIAALAKVLGLPALALYIAKTAVDAVRFASAGDLGLLNSVLAAFAIAICDALIAVNCYRRARILCK